MLYHRGQIDRQPDPVRWQEVPTPIRTSAHAPGRRAIPRCPSSHGSSLHAPEPDLHPPTLYHLRDGDRAWSSRASPRLSVSTCWPSPECSKRNPRPEPDARRVFHPSRPSLRSVKLLSRDRRLGLGRCTGPAVTHGLAIFRNRPTAYRATSRPTNSSASWSPSAHSRVHFSAPRCSWHAGAERDAKRFAD